MRELFSQHVHKQEKDKIFESPVKDQTKKITFLAFFISTPS